MNDVTKLLKRWAEEDRAFLASINRKSKWLDRSVIIGLFALIILAVGIGNAPHTAVEVPVVDSALVQRLQTERDHARKERDDYQRLSSQLKAMVKASNVTVAQLTDQLKALSVSVPPQPVILEAMRKEAVTEKGLRQVVARNFGADIAKRVRVTND